MSNHKEIILLVQKYEQTLAENKSVYFDADQFCDIADYYDSIGDMDAARELLKIALKIHPENDQLLLKKAKLYVYDSDYSQALHLLNIAFSGYDYDLYMVKIECLLHLSQLDEATELIEEVLNQEDEQELHTTLAELGFLFVETDNFVEAVNLFEESIKLDPENTEVLADLSYAYEMIGDFESAIAATNKILDIDAYNYDAWINLGKLFSMEENYEKAVDAFDFALTISDGDLNILKLKAHCLSLSNRPLDAMMIFKNVLKETPEDSTIYLLLCECYANLELFTEALECLTQYKEMEGDTMDLALKTTGLYFQMNKMSVAITSINEAMETYGRQLELLVLSGDIKYAMEDYESAELDYKEAYVQESDNFETLDKLALVSIKLEKYAEAINLSEELLLLGPEDQDIRQRLALLYFEIDDKEHFNNILDDFDDEELMDLFKLFYEPQHPELFDRELLISSLNEAREYRTLFKNLKY